LISLSLLKIVQLIPLLDELDHGLSVVGAGRSIIVGVLILVRIKIQLITVELLLVIQYFFAKFLTVERVGRERLRIFVWIKLEIIHQNILLRRYLLLLLLLFDLVRLLFLGVHKVLFLRLLDGFRIDQNWLGRLTNGRELVVDSVSALLLPIVLALIPLTWTAPFEFQMVPYYLVVVDIVILDFVQWAYYAQIFLQLLVLGYDRQSGRMMLLVVRDHVRNQWALARQKTRTRLKCLRMPHLRELLLLLPFLLVLKLLVLLRFVQWIGLVVSGA
jgi:hypothetical protein